MESTKDYRMWLVAMFMGVTLTANAQTETTDTTDIYKTQELGEVVVARQRPLVTVKTDKVTYQVENDAESKTRSVLEMLRKVPMVTVDGRNNITVNGSGQFKVYVDGRLNNAITRNPSQMLRNMPASNVTHIEVITNPGAQYDAEGAGGVLCITTKRGGAKRLLSMSEDEAESATSGSVHATAGTKTWGMDASISAQHQRWSYDLNLNAEYMYSPNAEMLSEAISKDSRQWMSQKSVSKMPFTMGEFSVGYEIDSVQSLHASISTGWFGMNDKGMPSYIYSGGMWGDAMNFTGNQTTKMSEVTIDGSIDYQRTWGERGRWFLNYQISHAPSRNDAENRYLGIDYTQRPDIKDILRDNRSEMREHTTEHILMSDLSIPLSENHLLNTGLKITANIGDSDAKELEFDDDDKPKETDACVHYRQHQYITALYSEWDARWGWFGMKSGVRYEHTWQLSRYLRGKGSDFSLHYGDLVPSITLSANASEKSTFGISYNMRIRRPGITELDPYVNSSDPTQLTYGNPLLDAQHLNSMAFVYTLSASKLALRMSLGHNWSNDGITQYSKILDGRIHTTYGNLSKNRTTSLNLFTSWSITGNTRLMLNGEVAYSDMRSPEIDAHSHGWHGNANIGIQQNLPWDMKWNTNMEWMSRRNTLQGYDSGMTMLTTTLSRSFCHDRLNIALSGMTGIGNGGKMVWESVSRSKDFCNTMRFVDSMQDITLGITYTFGGTSSKPKDMPMTNDFAPSPSSGQANENGHNNYRNMRRR